MRRSAPSLLATASLLALTGAAAVEPAAAPPPERQVVAFADGEPVYRDEVAPEAALRIAKLEAQIHALLEEAAREVVDERLLARQAGSRGLTVEALLREEEEIRAPVTADEVEAYLAEHPAETVGLEEARERVAFYLAERRRLEARLDFAERLREAAGYRFVLPEPALPRSEIDLAGAPRRGEPDAPVTLVHFAGFDAASARTAAVLRELQAEHPGQILWVHRHTFRLGDEAALAAAQAAVAAQEAGRFWEIHDRLLERAGEARASASLTELCREMGLPEPDRTERERWVRRVQEDIGLAHRTGINHAPVIFVNGLYYSGTFPPSRLHLLVRQELERTTTSAAGSEAAAVPAGAETPDPRPQTRSDDDKELVP